MIAVLRLMIAVRSTAFFVIAALPRSTKLLVRSTKSLVGVGASAPTTTLLRGRGRGNAPTTTLCCGAKKKERNLMATLLGAGLTEFGFQEGSEAGRSGVEAHNDFRCFTGNGRVGLCRNEGRGGG